MKPIKSPLAANISTRQLRGFLALAQLRNFTRAAEVVHLSQPAFSALVRTLEDSLGARLFERDTRRVALTVEGALFVEAARRLLGDLDLALHDLGEHTARRRGRVAIAALPSLAAGWLPDVLARFHAEHPGIVLDVADLLSDDCLERVRSGRADFALASVRAGRPDLRTERYASDRFYLVCRRDHPLAERERPALADLVGEPFIHLASDSSVRQHVDAAIAPARLNAVMELHQLSTVAAMVRAGLGVTVVPGFTLFHFEHPLLVHRMLRSRTLRREIYLIRPRDRGLSAAAQALHAHLLASRPQVDA